MRYATVSLVTFVVLVILILIIVIVIISVNENNSPVATPTTIDTRNFSSSLSSCEPSSSNSFLANNNPSSSMTPESSITSRNFLTMDQSIESSRNSPNSYYYTMLPINSRRLKTLGYTPLDKEFYNAHIANNDGKFLLLAETGIDFENQPSIQYHYKPEEGVLAYGSFDNSSPVRLRDIGTVSVYWNSETKLILIVKVKGQNILALHTPDRKLSPLHVLTIRS